MLCKIKLPHLEMLQEASGCATLRNLEAKHLLARLPSPGWKKQRGINVLDLLCVSLLCQ